MLFRSVSQSRYKGVDITTGILSAITNIGGLKGILTSFLNIIPNAISMWQAFGTQAQMSASEIELAGGAIVTTNDLITASIPLIGLVLAGITALIGGISAYNAKQEELKNKAIESLTTFEQSNKELEDSVTKVNDASTGRSQLISIIKQLDSGYDEEKGKLKDVNELRQKAIDKIYEEAKAKAKQTMPLIVTGKQIGRAHV